MAQQAHQPDVIFANADQQVVAQGKGDVDTLGVTTDPLGKQGVNVQTIGIPVKTGGCFDVVELFLVGDLFQEQARQPFSLCRVRLVGIQPDRVVRYYVVRPERDYVQHLVVENVGGDHLSPLKSHG